MILSCHFNLVAKLSARTRQIPHNNLIFQLKKSHELFLFIVFLRSVSVFLYWCYIHSPGASKSRFYVQFSLENWQEKREIENLQIKFVCDAVAVALWCVTRKYSALFTFRIGGSSVVCFRGFVLRHQSGMWWFSADIVNDKMTYVYRRHFCFYIFIYFYGIIFLPEFSVTFSRSMKKKIKF